MTQHSLDIAAFDPRFQALWQQCQTKLIARYMQGTMWDVKPVASANQAYIRMILILCSVDEVVVDKALLKKIDTGLQQWTKEQVHALLHYCSTPPKPSIAELNVLLSTAPRIDRNPRTWQSIAFTEQRKDHDDISWQSMPLKARFLPRKPVQYNKADAADLIQHFESVLQAYDAKGQSKRRYTFSEKENKRLIKVLQGIKRKDHGVLSEKDQNQLLHLLFLGNNFALADTLSEKTGDQLIARLHDLAQEMKIHADSPEQKSQSAACQLAVMREILLRKTGKWVNSTQMLDLLYAAIHNDESLLHQVRTGEGKSIITVMRTAYLALNGAIVDVFSAKESLSQRDAEEFAPVLEGMGVRQAYITASSDASVYHDKIDANGIGAVNYATPGNLSLFLANQIWTGKNHIALDRDNRVAFLDEADQLLNDDQTLFNFADNQQNQGIYNYDEWVYRATYEFFLHHKASFKNDEQTGCVMVSNHQHLEPLCQFIQDRSISKPDKSTFIDQFIIPALKNDKEAILKRDSELLRLLSACIKAHNLKVDRDFCVREEKKSLEDMVVEVHVDKVVVDRQIREGSTYSDLVHQFLHVISNQEYAEQGKKPAFFVDPVSQVALTENATHLLLHRYHKMEGATGTVGNKADRTRYRDVFGINHIVKIPTHQERQTTFLPTEYCDSFQAQVESVAQLIINNRNKSLFIPCQDDADVKRFYQAVCLRLHKEGQNNILDRMTCDTNDSGKSEAQALLTAGGNGAVTFSARMGRGTDFKPENELMVIRRYPARPRDIKQEYGRQGRNGSVGSCVEIINYAEVLEAEQLFLSSELYPIVLAEETKHLEAKLAKHQRQGTSDMPRWRVFSDKEYKERYLKTRVIEELKHRKKQENIMYQQLKNNLMVALSGTIFNYLADMKPDADEERRILWTAWLGCRAQIEELWVNRLAGGKHDGEAVYNDFSAKVLALFTERCKIDVDGDVLIKEYHNKHGQLVEASFEPNVETTAYAEFVGQFYGTIHLLTEQTLHSEGVSEELRHFIYGAEGKKIHAGLRRFELSKENMDEKEYKSKQLVLYSIIEEAMSRFSGFKISFNTYADVVNQLSSLLDEPDYPFFLQGMSHFFNQPWLNRRHIKEESVPELIKINRLLPLVMKVITRGFVSNKTSSLAEENQEDWIDYEDPASLILVTHLSEVIKEHFWADFDDDFSERVRSVLAVNPEVTRLLTQWSSDEITGKEKINRLIQLIDDSKNDTDQGVKRRQKLVNYLQMNHQGFEEHEDIIEPAIELLLTAREEHLDKTNLPPAKCLPSHQLDKIYWEFLAQRAPIQEDEWRNMQGLFDRYKDQEEVLSRLVHGIKTLPAFMPLGYVYKHFNELTNIKNLDQSIRDLTTAGEVLVQFMRQHEWLETEGEYERPKLACRKYFDHYLTCFSKLTPKQNHEFFSEAKLFDKKSLPQINALVLAYANKKIDQQQMLNLMQLLKHIKKSSRNFLFAYNDLLADYSSYKYERITQFISMVEDTLKDQEIPEISYTQLYHKYLDRKLSIKQSQMEGTLRVLGDAVVLRDNPIRWVTLFQSSKQERNKLELIISHVLHKTIDLGTEFRQKCMDEYNLFAERIINENKTSHKPFKERFVPIILLAREVASIVKNPYSNSDQPPDNLRFSRNNSLHQFFASKKKEYDRAWGVNRQRSGEAALLFNALDSHSSFSSKAAYYEQLLKTIVNSQQQLLQNDKGNTARRSLSPFGLLKRSLCAMFGCSYDNKTFGFQLNRQGSSRLYNITMELLIRVAEEYMQDPQVPVEARGALNPLIDAQLKFHIMELKDRLPGNELKTKLQQYTQNDSAGKPFMDKGSAEETRLGNVIAAINLHRDSIPKTLHYLLTPIEAFQNVQAPKADYSAPGFAGNWDNARSPKL